MPLLILQDAVMPEKNGVGGNEKEKENERGKDNSHWA